jgi:hypothetical protein
VPTLFYVAVLCELSRNLLLSWVASQTGSWTSHLSRDSGLLESCCIHTLPPCTVRAAPKCCTCHPPSKEHRRLVSSAESDFRAVQSNTPATTCIFLECGLSVGLNHPNTLQLAGSGSPSHCQPLSADGTNATLGRVEKGRKHTFDFLGHLLPVSH